MNYEEAMVIVDAGGIVARESGWIARAAGFSWGPWMCLDRSYVEADFARERERVATSGWIRGEACLTPTGSYIRAWHTLCESVMYPDKADIPGHLKEAVDWIDVTERFLNGTPKGYTEYMVASVNLDSPK